ncbi:MAG: carbohydrate kinase, partial [Bacilli bacterium]
MQRNQVICFGEALIDLLPEQNGQPLKDVPSFQRNPGGAPANVAAAVAKLGGQARFVGMVGEDAFGHFLKDTLDDLHIDTTYFQFSTEAHTALAFVSLKENGERDFMFYRSPSADMLVEASHIKDKIFDDGLIFHFGSVLQASEPSRSATTMAIEKAKQQGLLIHYDPNVRLPLWQNPEEAKELILATLPLADIVKISDEEL